MLFSIAWVLWTVTTRGASSSTKRGNCGKWCCVWKTSNVSSLGEEVKERERAQVHTQKSESLLLREGLLVLQRVDSAAITRRRCTASRTSRTLLKFVPINCTRNCVQWFGLLRPDSPQQVGGGATAGTRPVGDFFLLEESPSVVSHLWCCCQESETGCWWLVKIACKSLALRWLDLVCQA